MSVINFTLVIQAINFFIAFFCIKYFFFKTAVVHVQAEEVLQKSLINAVQEHQSVVAQKEQEIRDHWNALQSYFATHAPSLQSPPLYAAGKLPWVVAPQFDKVVIDQQIQALTAELIKKVDHVG